ncbi:MAG: DNA polymerase IV [Thiohalocapsa sp.]|nr:DNA polymerase IV [Thiohalocapsa sp.]
MQRWIMHVDMDAFYASIEQRDDPRLRGRPVVVGALPGGRGVVATCSYEARRYGIRSAMPIAEAYKRCPGATYLRPRMAHYAAVSRHIRAVFDGISPLVEPVSIDEAFVDVSGLERLIGPPAAIGARVKADIDAAVGLSASVGIGPNRLIAKLASEHRKPDALTVVGPDALRDFLDPLPVSALRGVGPRTLVRVRRLGIETVADLRRRPVDMLQAQLGARLAMDLHRQAHGLASAEVVADATRKSISKETTFSSDQRSRGLLHDTLAELAAAVVQTARAEGVVGRVVTLKIRFAGFDTYTRQRRLTQPTDSARVLLAEGRALLEQAGLPDKPVRLIGIGLSALQPPQALQADLFDAPDALARDSRLGHTLDAVNARFGDGALRLGLHRDTQPRQQTADLPAPAAEPDAD